MSAKILLPLDGSALAERALPCAEMLARGLPAEMVLFRAVELGADVTAALEEADVSADAPLQALMSHANEYLRGIANDLLQEGMEVQFTVQGGAPADTIVDYAEQQGIDYIVMATHGYSGISRWRHGSVAERVLHGSRVPVLMLRAAKRPPDPAHRAMECQHILIPLDGSKIAEQVLPPAIAVAKALNACVSLFRVPIVAMTGALLGDWYMPLEGVLDSAEQEASSYLNNVAKEIDQESIRVQTAMQIGGVADAIVSYADANEVDMIAMCTHGRTGLVRWTLGSVADRVLRAAYVPLMLVRARGE
jgi:nucleotide-binding universal stress UspA family protein